jgi:hypothetical protein
VAGLVPQQDLEPDREAGPAGWVATGPDPQFFLDSPLPAGWLRVRLQMISEVRGWLELSSRGNGGRTEVEWVRQAAAGEAVRGDFFLYLRRPARGLRFDPLDGPGKFRLEALQVTPVPARVALLHALGRKLRILLRHRLVGRCVWNALGLLRRGRFGELVSKLQGGLQDCQPRGTAAAPPSDPCQQVMEFARVRPVLDRPFDVIYVLNGAGLSGGAKVVLEHASRLYARGHNVRVYYRTGALDWFARPVPSTRFADLESLRRGLARFRGIKVATWYETAPWVAESLRPGDRGYYLVQDVEECYGSTRREAGAALRTYALGLKPLTLGLWVHRQLTGRFGLAPARLGMGLDFDIFQPRPVPREPHLLMTPARTWSGGGRAGVHLKGWDTAREVVLRCHRLEPRTRLATFSIEDRHPLTKDLAHVHFAAASDRKLSELYSRAGVFLLTSRHEGFGLTAAEAMACGCPVVASRAQGNEEFCLDGFTALTAPADDVGQLARHCLRLQSDPALAAELGRNGRAFIARYTWDLVIDRLEREFRREPPRPEARASEREQPASAALWAGEAVLRGS